VSAAEGTGLLYGPRTDERRRVQGLGSVGVGSPGRFRARYGRGGCSSSLPRVGHGNLVGVKRVRPKVTLRTAGTMGTVAFLLGDIEDIYT